MRPGGPGAGAGRGARGAVDRNKSSQTIRIGVRNTDGAFVIATQFNDARNNKGKLYLALARLGLGEGVDDISIAPESSSVRRQFDSMQRSRVTERT